MGGEAIRRRTHTSTPPQLPYRRPCAQACATHRRPATSRLATAKDCDLGLSKRRMPPQPSRFVAPDARVIALLFQCRCDGRHSMLPSASRLPKAEIGATRRCLAALPCCCGSVATATGPVAIRLRNWVRPNSPRVGRMATGSRSARCGAASISGKMPHLQAVVHPGGVEGVLYLFCNAHSPTLLGRRALSNTAREAQVG
jgi:hypothetical protein